MLPEEGHKDEELKKDEKIIEEEDPLLPPLPTPKKLPSYIISPIPRPVPQETITVPAESIGDGGNKKVGNILVHLLSLISSVYSKHLFTVPYYRFRVHQHTILLVHKICIKFNSILNNIKKQVMW